MEIRVPAQLFAVPERREFSDARDDGTVEKRTVYRSGAIIGQDSIRFWSGPEDPAASLNGSRAKLEAGEIVPVTAVLRLYAGSKGGPGVALERYEERSAAGK